MEGETLDPRELLERLHADRRSLVWQPLKPSANLIRWRQRPMSEEQALEYLHGHWALPDEPDVGVAGGGVKGLLLARFARICFRVLRPYLQSERELIARMVRMHETLARRCDELAHSLAEHETRQAENDARLAAWLQDHADQASMTTGEN